MGQNAKLPMKKLKKLTELNLFIKQLVCQTQFYLANRNVSQWKSKVQTWKNTLYEWSH